MGSPALWPGPLSAFRLLALCVLTKVLLLASAAAAFQADTMLRSQAGLVSGLAISCTPLMFGVLTVDGSTRASNDDLDIDPGDDVRFWKKGVPNTGLAMINGSRNGYVARAICTVSGSVAPAGTALTLTVSPSDRKLTMAGSVSRTVFGLRTPPRSKTGVMVTLSAPPVVAINSAGAATFHLGGTLTLPPKFDLDELGSYLNSTVVTITANDGI